MENVLEDTLNRQVGQAPSLDRFYDTLLKKNSLMNTIDKKMFFDIEDTSTKLGYFVAAPVIAIVFYGSTAMIIKRVFVGCMTNS